MKIIGVCGKAGVGKDYITYKYLIPYIQEKRYLVLAFADHFKFECIVKDGLDENKVFGIKDEYTRGVLQQRGTEQGRNVNGENYWVNILDIQIRQYSQRFPIDYIFITDVRFPNEAEYIRRNKGLLIEVRSKEEYYSGSTYSHISETQNINGDLIIYNERGKDINIDYSRI